MYAFACRLPVLCVVLAAACSRPPAEPAAAALTDAELGVPATAPSLVGVVAAVEPDRRVLLEHRPVRPECRRQALVTLTPDTRVVRRRGSDGAAPDIRAGQRVTAWFGGVELRSCPVQVSAVAIVIE